MHDSDPQASKIAIVCLHAIGHGGGGIAAFEANFSKTFRIITVDWPGRGVSAADGQPVRARRIGPFLASLRDGEEVHAPHV